MLFINDIDHTINSGSNIWLYADDMKIARSIEKPDDHSKLQEDINSVFQWSVENKMKFHPKKCKVLTSTLKKSPSQLAYSISGSPLQKSKAEKDLGVIVSENLNWNKHHNVILGKASQKLGLLRRSCSFSKVTQSRKVFQVWRPTNTTHINKFKSIQKRGIKWVQ